MRPAVVVPPARRRAGLALAAMGVVFVLLLTLIPAPEEARRSQQTPITCLVCGEIGMQDVLQNVAMLLPLGVGLGLAGVGLAGATTLGFALALTVEVLQYTVVAGRDASLSDVVTNTLGTALGVLLARRLHLLTRPSPREAGALAAGMLGVWLALWLGAAWMLGLSAGPDPWRLWLRPALIDAPPFEGEVRAAEVSGVPLPREVQYDSGQVRAHYARDTLSVRMALVAGPPTTSRRGLLELKDGNHRVNGIVAQMATDARLAIRTRSSLLLLRPLRFRAPHVFAVPQGTPVQLDLRREGGWMVTGAAHEGAPATRTGIGPHWLSFLLLPIDARPGVGWEAFAYWWVALSLVLVGWWAMQAAASLRAALVVVAAIAAGVALALVPARFDLAPTSPLGWAIAGTALVSGLLLGGGRRRFRP